jgi:hypothetical protein
MFLNSIVEVEFMCLNLSSTIAYLCVFNNIKHSINF